MTNKEPPLIADVIASCGRMLTLDELAELLTISPKTLYARVRSGSIPVTRIGASIRFDPLVASEWLRRQTL